MFRFISIYTDLIIRCRIFNGYLQQIDSTVFKEFLSIGQYTVNSSLSTNGKRHFFVSNLRTRHHAWLISNKCFQVSGQIIPIESIVSYQPVTIVSVYGIHFTTDFLFIQFVVPYLQFIYGSLNRRILKSICKQRQVSGIVQRMLSTVTLSLTGQNTIYIQTYRTVTFLGYRHMSPLTHIQITPFDSFLLVRNRFIGRLVKLVAWRISEFQSTVFYKKQPTFCTFIIFLLTVGQQDSVAHRFYPKVYSKVIEEIIYIS